MGLDLYAGTLTRYYAHNWKTESQQWAEAHSFGYQKITSEMESKNSMSTEEVQQVIETWRDSLLSAIRTEGTSVRPGPKTMNVRIIPVNPIGPLSKLCCCM